MQRVTSFRPVGTKVLVEPIYQQAQVGRIHVPEAYKEDRPQEACVVAVGPRAKVEVKVGDRVLTDAFAGTHIAINGKVHRLMEQGDLVAVVGQV